MTFHPISILLEDFKQNLEGDMISFGDLLHAFEDRSVAFFLFIFALPAAIPLPGFGVNFIIGIPLLVLTIQQTLQKKHVWLPRKIREKKFRRTTFETIANSAIPWLGRFEIFIRPRLLFITNGVGKSVIGLICFIMALSVCVPLPLTNTVPSFAITIMSVGVMTRDGLAVIAGAIIGLVWVGLLIWAAIFLGAEGLEALGEMIKSYM